MPTLLQFADHESVSMRHVAEFFALFGGSVRRVSSRRRRLAEPADAHAKPQGK